MSLELWHLWLVLGGTIIGVVIYYVHESRELKKRQKKVAVACLNEAMGYLEDEKIPFQKLIKMFKGLNRIYLATTDEKLLVALRHMGFDIPTDLLVALNDE